MSKPFRATAVLVLLTAAVPLAAQTPPTPAPAAPPPPPAPPAMMTAADDDDGFTVRGSSVGYIDTAVPGNVLLFRTDFGYDFRFPNRAEMFYPQGRPGGPGLPLPERSIDYQDLTVYAEKAVGCRGSVFTEFGTRFLNPEVNRNAAGYGDMAVGFKYALLTGERGVGTFQLKTYIPSGNPNLGLGNGHASIEPGLLGIVRASDRLALVGELRYWVPAGGTDFAGSVMRYGLGTRYELWQSGDVRLASTFEAVGWSVLAGRQSRLQDDGTSPTEGAGGVSVLNLKAGARVDVGPRLGFYMGYGRAVTGQKWYADVLRVEARWLY